MDDKSKPQSYKEKHTRWKKYQYCQTNTNKGLYETAKREARNEIKAAKMGYEKRLSENIKTNSKPFWNYVQSKTKTRESVGNLIDDRGELVTEGIKKSTILKEFFTSVFT